MQSHLGCLEIDVVNCYLKQNEIKNFISSILSQLAIIIIRLSLYTPTMSHYTRNFCHRIKSNMYCGSVNKLISWNDDDNHCIRREKISLGCHCHTNTHKTKFSQIKVNVEWSFSNKFFFVDIFAENLPFWDLCVACKKFHQ
jgi:hypothetical protein